MLTWEVAGTTHGDWKLIVEHGPLRIRDVGAPPDDYPPNGPTLCAGPTFSRIPFYMTQGAAYDHLARWVTTGRRPPQAPRIPLPVARDADGNALGGIRLPQFAVPDRRPTPAPTPAPASASCTESTGRSRRSGSTPCTRASSATWAR